MKDLQPYPDGGLGSLTEAEQRVIDNLSVSDALEIAISLIAGVANTLVVQANEDHAAARAVGFENAEHDMLTFIGSDWFDLIVDAAQAFSPDAPDPREYAQALVDAGLGPGTLQVVAIEPRVPVRRIGKPQRGHEYILALVGTLEPGTDVVAAYEARIRAEQERPETITLELAGLTLTIEVSYDDPPPLCDI